MDTTFPAQKPVVLCKLLCGFWVLQIGGMSVTPRCRGTFLEVVDSDSEDSMVHSLSLPLGDKTHELDPLVHCRCCHVGKKRMRKLEEVGCCGCI